MIFTFELYEDNQFAGIQEVEADNEAEAYDELETVLAETGNTTLEYQLAEDLNSLEGKFCEHCARPLQEGHDCPDIA